MTFGPLLYMGVERLSPDGADYYENDGSFYRPVGVAEYGPNGEMSACL